MYKVLETDSRLLFLFCFLSRGEGGIIMGWLVRCEATAVFFKLCCDELLLRAARTFRSFWFFFLSKCCYAASLY